MSKIPYKVAVITGATSGIGRATAKALNANGIKLVLHGRNQALLNELGEELHAKTLCGDINDSLLPQELVDLAINHYGTCDICINNAAIMEVGKIEAVDIDVICQMARTNVEAAYRVAYTFLKYFKAKDFGYLINLSSVLGEKVRETAGAYAGTKYAIEALSEALRIELARTNIKITSIEPGLVMTGLHRKYDVHPKDALNIEKALMPEDIADTIMYLLSTKPHVRIPKMMILPKDHAI